MNLNSYLSTVAHSSLVQRFQKISVVIYYMLRYRQLIIPKKFLIKFYVLYDALIMTNL